MFVPDRTPAAVSDTLAARCPPRTSTFLLGGDLEVYRLGFGAMRITGDGHLGRAGRSRRLPRAAPPRRRARRQPDRHRRLLRAGGLREPDRRGAAALSGEPGDRHQGWTRASGAQPLGAELPSGPAQALLRGLADAAEARADRPLPAAHRRPEGADRGLGRRARRAPGGGEDPPYRRVQRHARGPRASPADRRRSSRSRTATTSPTAPPRTSSASASARGSRSSPGPPSPAGGPTRPGGAVAEIARRHGATPRQVALAWLLQHSPVTLPIPGTSTIAHFEENLEAAQLELEDDELEALDELAPAA